MIRSYKPAVGVENMQIILDHLDYTYSKGTAFERQALRDINMVVDKGEFVCIIGKTGSGKSTLIQMFNGLLKPDSGNVYFEGKDIYDKDYSIRELRGKVGLVFQYPEHQLFEASVIEDVKFGPRNIGMSSLDIDINSYKALKMVGIGDELIDASPFELSGGEKRRVAIAGILAMKPQVLILDEPTAGLDPKGREEILELVAQLNRENGITVVLVSHSMDDVAKYADKLIVLKDGSISYNGRPKEIFAHKNELEDMGLDIPSAAKVLYRLKEDGYPVHTDKLSEDDVVNEIVRLVK